MGGLIFGGVLCVCATVCGFGIHNFYLKRKKFAEEWLEFAKSAEQNIRFVKKPLTDIFAEYCAGKKSEFAAALRGYADLLRRSADDEESVAKICASGNLRKSERAALAAFLRGLGKTDYDSQIALLQNDVANLETLAARCKKDYDSMGKLAYKLGFLLGLALMVVAV